MAGIISNNVVTDGLIFYLDAANTKSYVSGSTTWSDLSQNQKDTALINGSTFDSGNLGSIVFDGVNDYVVSNSSFSLPSTVTYSCWIKCNIGANLQTLFTDSGQAGTLGFIWIFRAAPSSNSISFKYADGTIAISASGMWNNFNNLWLNITISVDYTNAIITLYKNGVLHSGPNALLGTPLPPRNLAKNIGSYNGSQSFFIRKHSSNTNI